VSLNLTVAPAVEPLTLDEARDHLRITHHDDDEDLQRFIMPAARSWCEVYTCRAFLLQTYTLTLSGFGPGPIVLPKPPLSSVTSITYLDETGASQTWSSALYQVVAPSGPYAQHASIEPAFGEVYPTTRGIRDDVTITYVAGYGATRLTVPEALRQGVRIVCEDYYSQRSSQTVGTSVITNLRAAESVLWPFRVCRADLRFA